MQGINTTGLGGSSLDVEGLVDQLISAEGAPAQNRLDRQEVEVQTTISALGTFQGALSEFQGSLESLRNAEDFYKVSATSSDEEKVEIIATNEAQSGTYSVDVLQLATSNRLTSESFESELNPIGSGNLSFQFGKVNPENGQFLVNEKATVKNIKITDENNSLLGIAEAINVADFGVQASIINDGVGYRLAISTEATGEINGLRIVVNDNDNNDTNDRGLSRLSYDPTDPAAMNLIETGVAQDAMVMLDGIEIASPSNDISDAITGVTLTLNSLTGDDSVQVTTKFDIEAVRESIAAFISTYNEMIATIQAISGIDPETGKGGPLSGDSAVRGIAEQIRRQVGASYNGVNDDFGSLASIGIETQRDGTLTIDDSKVQSAIEDNFEEVTKLFARAGSASDSLIRFSSADEGAVMGAHEVTIRRLASKGQYVSEDNGQLNNFTISAGENKLILRVDGATSDKVAITLGKYATGEDLADELERKINKDEIFKREGVSTSVQFVLGQFVIESNRLGSQSRVEVLSSDDNIRSLGIDPAEGINGQDVEGRIGSLPGEGNGTMLKGTGAANGINIEILGGKLGERGTVSFSMGVAEQLSNSFSSFTGSGGLLKSRTNGLDNRVDDINQQRDRLARRLAVSEERLLKQFSNLDASLGRMRSTSNFLSNQLAGLPGAPKQGDR